MSLNDIIGPWRDVMVELVRDEQPDLSMRQWALLLTVYLDPGPHTVKRLSENLEVPKPAISRALDALSIHGLVRRVRDLNDKRIVIVQKTPEGSEFLDRFAAAVEAGERSAELSGWY
ncbi:MAG: MarR family transcriptional regulator [Parvularcula sp.]|jgi:DNA-binding MarR family transcriptional regulator|nr:MarR family transcriptional regulator [Parvularcula sp.]